MAGKNNTPPARVAVTLTGTALLAAIAASEVGYLMLTQSEGSDIVSQGFAEVDTSIVEGETAAVKLTDAGKAELEKANAPAAVNKSGFEIEDFELAPSTKARRGRQGGYPFDTLEVGKHFHVALDKDETIEELKARLSSSVSGARTKFAKDTGEVEDFVQKTYKKGDDGKFAKDENGKRIVETETTIQRPKLEIVRDFEVIEVGETDPKGVGVRIRRTA